MEKCPHCKIRFIPDPRVGKRQKTCGRPACKRALKAENNRIWRQRNPDCYRNDYSRLSAWLEQNPGYLKCCRQSHAEYIEKNRKAQQVRDRRKKLRLDIQAQLKKQSSDITNEMRESTNLDMQAQLETKPFEMTFIFSAILCLDIQFQMDAPISPPTFKTGPLDRS